MRLRQSPPSQPPFELAIRVQIFRGEATSGSSMWVDRALGMVRAGIWARESRGLDPQKVLSRSTVSVQSVCGHERPGVVRRPESDSRSHKRSAIIPSILRPVVDRSTAPHNLDPQIFRFDRALNQIPTEHHQQGGTHDAHTTTLTTPAATRSEPLPPTEQGGGDFGVCGQGQGRQQQQPWRRSGWANTRLGKPSERGHLGGK